MKPNNTPPPDVVAVHITAQPLAFDLKDGRSIGVPLAFIPPCFWPHPKNARASRSAAPPCIGRRWIATSALNVCCAARRKRASSRRRRCAGLQSSRSKGADQLAEGGHEHGEDISGDPHDGETNSGEAVLREIGRHTERLFHTVQSRFHAEKDVEAWCHPRQRTAEPCQRLAGVERPLGATPPVTPRTVSTLEGCQNLPPTERLCDPSGVVSCWDVIRGYRRCAPQTRLISVSPSG